MHSEQVYSSAELLSLCAAKPVYGVVDATLSLPLFNMQPLPPEQAYPSGWHLRVFAESLNGEKLQSVVNALGRKLGIERLHLVQPDIAPGQVLAMFPCQPPSEDIAAQLEQLAVQQQVELALLKSPPSLSRPGLLLMDMDSTVIGVECIDEIATLAGVGEQVSAVTEQAMQGNLAFSDSLRQRLACMQGASASILHTVRDGLPLMPGITHLLQTLKSRGWKLAIASGGFTYFADYLLLRLGLDAAVANTLEIENDRLTGNVVGDIVDATVKAETLTSLAASYGIESQQTVALGDGANDLQMMERAGLGVAYHAKPVVRQRADAGIRFANTAALLLLFNP
ncbi:phosphoserine phosphatase SerB [Aestuariibacter halophilus]|uniref:Phosphoserine phosphatase n=2 Tax=Fluctibacter halophilus TaxID=226011 RepID=A0ABS8G2K7_9ALTE|nr:phosphoserine phosphatase SerB [Aestuariibacter halophilus]